MSASKKNVLQVIGEKEMDRKEFLKYSGVALLSIAGFKTIANLISKTDKAVSSNLEKKEATRGFGSGKYGA